MFKAIISQDYSVVANTNIPLTVTKHTNGDISYNSSNNTIVFNRPGHYHVDFHIVTTDVAENTDITVAEILNGTASDTVIGMGLSSGTTDFITLDLPDILSVTPSYVSDKATLSYQANVACTGVTGYVTIYRIGR